MNWDLFSTFLYYIYCHCLTTQLYTICILVYSYNISSKQSVWYEHRSQSLDSNTE